MRISFAVLGIPAPQGSLKAFVAKKTGRAFVTQDNKRTMPWRQDVASAAEMMRSRLGFPVGTWPTSQAVRFKATFYLPRPMGHFGKKGLRPTAPKFPAKKPDLSKLVRAAEDALSGIIYDDDARIVEHCTVKLYADGVVTPRADFEIAILE